MTVTNLLLISLTFLFLKNFKVVLADFKNIVFMLSARLFHLKLGI